MAGISDPSKWALPAAVIAICAFLTAVMRISYDSFAIFLLPLSREFGWARAETAGIYGAMMLCFGIGCPIAGRLMDHWGPRWTYVLGAVGLALGFWAARSSSALWQFYLAIGVCVGLSGALVGTVSHAALLARWFGANLTIAIAAAAAASGIGVLVFAPLLQWLIDADGWRWTYAMLAAVALGLAVILFALPWHRLGGPKTPVLARRAPPASGSDPVALSPPVTGARDAYRQTRFWALFGLQFLTAVSVFSLNPQIVALLVDHGFDPLASASAFGAAGFMGTAGLMVFGWLADRRGRTLALSLSFAMTIAGFAALGLVTVVSSWWLVGLFVLIYGPTFGARGPIVNGLIPRVFGRGPSLGLILGSVHMGLGLGAATGATLGGYLHDISGYRAVILVAIAASAAALTLYLSVGSVRKA
ncbi:MAG: MFS transporter [Alphaproteobacteria bacterium]|nr:MFS transporter [Alphaproteobacteria bacterium]MCB9928077.1 MFS transporter [Alphaproteobacteria bacterium]